MSVALNALLGKRASYSKRAFVPVTDPAMQAMQAPPQGQPPMDPSMMPPQGAPMDPSMMGQPPMGGAPMPPQGGTGDPVLDQLMAIGFTFDQQGNVYDPNGQPVPPEALNQLAQQIMAQMGGQPPMDPSMTPPPGAPMDPSMGGQPPMDPNMAPPPEADPMAMMADMINTILDERMSNLDKRIAAITDKLDTVRSLLEDILENKDKKESGAMADETDKEIQQMLATSQQEQVPPPQMMAPAAPEQAAPGSEEMDLLASLGGAQ